VLPLAILLIAEALRLLSIRRPQED